MIRDALDLLFGSAVQLLSGLQLPTRASVLVVEVYGIFGVNGLELQSADRRT
jgi:hypothetical protein